MKNVLSRSRALLFVVLTVVLSLSTVTVLAQQISKQTEVYFVPLQFVFDGKQYAPPADQQGFIYNGSTYVPLRFVSYALNKDVQWEQSSYTVTIKEPDKQAKITIQDYNLNREVRNAERKKADTSDLKASEIEVYEEKVTYVFDGVVKEPSAELPGFIYENVLYVPIRFFSESLNRKIDWDQDTYTVSANTKIDQLPTEKPGTTPGEVPPSPSSKPSAESLIAAARSQLSSMESSATSSFMSMAMSYLSTKDASVRASIKAQAESLLSQLDSQVASITGDLEAQLKANGYDTSEAAAMRQEYADKKAAGRAALEQMR